MKKSLVILLVISTILWSSVDVIIVSIVPVFVTMFADFGARLPTLTQACFHLSHLTKLYYFIFEPLFIGALVGVSVLIARKENNTLAIYFCASGALAVLALVGTLSLPIFQLGAVAAGMK